MSVLIGDIRLNAIQMNVDDCLWTLVAAVWKNFIQVC